MIKTILAFASIASALAAGALGLLVCATVGPDLAMGAQMYTGNLEPRRPEMALPWALAAALALIPVPLLVKKRVALATVAAIPFAVLPWWQLWRLFGEAGRG